MIKNLLYKIKNQVSTLAAKTDLVLLIFLVLILNVSLAFKLLALGFIYVLRPDFKFGFKQGRLPLFYLSIILLSLLQFLFNYNRGFNYALLASLSLTFWGASLLINHQLKLAIEKQGREKVENAISVFFILNALVSFINLFKIMVETKTLNPYTFNGFDYKYSASTGDYIHGIMGDLSTANMIINAFAVFYFMYKKKYTLSVLCFIVATYTTSNLGNIILFIAFLAVVITDSSKLHKSLALCYVSFLILFIVKVSPSNLNYLDYKLQGLFHLEKRIIEPHFKDNTEKDKLISSYVSKYKMDVVAAKSNKQEVSSLIFEKEQLERTKTIEEANHPHIVFSKKQEGLLDFYERLYGDTSKTLNRPYFDQHPGKYTSFLETFSYLRESPRHFLIGAGPGNFSSKLAYKASNIGISGKYVEKFQYVAPEFKNNHLKISLNYYLQPSTEHSIINFPNSVLNQLLGEYGFAGLLLFFVLYVWFYLKRFKTLTYGRIILPLLLAFLLTDYWMESFTIVIIFELLMFVDLSEKETKQETL